MKHEWRVFVVVGLLILGAFYLAVLLLVTRGCL